MVDSINLSLPFLCLTFLFPSLFYLFPPLSFSLSLFLSCLFLTRSFFPALSVRHFSLSCLIFLLLSFSVLPLFLLLSLFPFISYLIFSALSLQCFSPFLCLTFSFSLGLPPSCPPLSVLPLLSPSLSFSLLYPLFLHLSISPLSYLLFLFLSIYPLSYLLFLLLSISLLFSVPLLVTLVL